MSNENELKEELEFYFVLVLGFILVALISLQANAGISSNTL
jgi:hypothetical protein